MVVPGHRRHSYLDRRERVTADRGIVRLTAGVDQDQSGPDRRLTGHARLAACGMIR
jgi:hypothetical protein